METTPAPPPFTVARLDAAHAERIVALVRLLNPSLTTEVLAERLAAQWDLGGYHCFGLLDAAGTIVGVASAWVSVRLYGGKLAELDNVIVEPSVRGQGAGSFFLGELERRLRAEGCRRIELKTYVTNARSHKFYFDHGYSICAYYFVKELHGASAAGCAS